MNEESTELVRELNNTFLLMEGKTDKDRLQVFASELRKYTPRLVIKALQRMRTKENGYVTLAKILKYLDIPKYISAEEAWGQIPKNEEDSALLTYPMRAAAFDPGVIGFLDEHNPARAFQLFSVIYGGYVTEAESNNIPPTYEIYYGRNKDQRDEILLIAGQKGLLTQQQIENRLGRPLEPLEVERICSKELIEK